MSRIGKGLFFAVPLCLLLSASVQSQTINAASCNSSDVQTALNSVNQASATVNIPAGTCTWTSQLTYTVPGGTTSLVIQGAGAESATTGGAGTTGTDQTIITDAATTSANAFSISATGGQSLRITGIAFVNNNSAGSYTVLGIDGTSSAVRVDHCHFTIDVDGLSGLDIGGSVTGVADHDYFSSPDTLTNDMAFHNGEGWGDGNPGDNADGSWADTDHWGSSEFFFVEDTQFYNGDVSDAHDGARYVIRHCTITGDGGSSQQIYNHGLTDARGRSTRAAEVYENTFTEAGNQGNPTFSLNSGTLLFWGNSVTGGWGNGVTIGYNFRNLAGGGGNYGYLAPKSGWGFCGTAAGGPTNWDGNHNTSSGYPCLDQPGRGKGDALNGQPFPNVLDSVTGAITWPHQALSPIYVWDNTWSPKYYTNNGIVGNSSAGSGGALATDNQDFFQQYGNLAEPGSNCTGSPCNITAGINQTSRAPVNGTDTCAAKTDPMTGAAAPGVGWWDTSNSTLYVCTATNTWTAYYTPYTYPHPLTQSTAGVNPPSDLTATPH